MPPAGKVISLGKGNQWPGVGPFIFAVHHLDLYPKGDGKLGPGKAAIGGRALGSDFMNPSGWSMYHGDTIPGFPPHPHRGFETVSVVRQGYIDHADSTGAAARYGAGDTQWVTAGNGVSHSEMFPLINEDKPNHMELYQLWLNLPAKNKKAPAEFKMLWQEQVPVVTRESTHGVARVSVVAGKFDNTEPLAPPKASWASDPASDVAIWLIELEAGASIKVPVTHTPETKRTFYVHGVDNDPEAKVNIGGMWVDAGNAFEQDPAAGPKDRLTLTACPKKPALVLVLQGREIGEPVVQHGPFVMNTQAEIQQAFTDYQRTKFGGWPWDSDQPTHGKEPRFARYNKERVEYPEGKPVAAKA